MVDKLKDYLYGADFVVKNDNNLLAFVLTMAKLNANRHTVGGWLPTVSPRGQNRDADALSRRPYHPETLPEQWTQVTSEGVEDLCQGEVHRARAVSRAEAIGVSVAGVPKYYCDLSQVRDEGLLKLLKKDWRKDQMGDPLCSLTLKALEGQSPDLLLQKKHIWFITNRIGYSYVTGLATKGAPWMILKIHFNCSCQKSIERLQ